MALPALDQQIADFEVPAVECGSIVARDLVSSSLQKSLRRGSLRTALVATKILMEGDPEYFWRRLVTIVFEDFGLSNLILTNDVVIAAQRREWRRRSNQSFKAAAYLIFKLSQTPRDRRIDDLYMLAHACLKSAAYQQKVDHASGWLAPLVEETKRLCLLCERPVPMRSIRALNAGACESHLQKWDDKGLVTGLVIHQGGRDIPGKKTK